jgi:probable HAF family extracellular repeat protein
MKRLNFIASLILAASASTASIARAQYTAYDLGPGIAYGINDSGTVVGQSGGGYAFSYSGGMMTDLGVGAAYGINNAGTIVGGTDGSILARGNAFSYSSGVMNYLGSGSAYGINASGTIVGVTTSGDAFSYSSGVMTSLFYGTAYGINDSGTVVGSSGSGPAVSYSGGVINYFGSGSAYGINASGTIVGSASLGDASDSIQAFSYSGDVMTYLGSPGLSGAARGINSSGTIVGDNAANHAFVYSDGVMTDLSPYLDSIGLIGVGEANAINDDGDIVGLAFNASGERDAFLLEPSTVPEPSTVAPLAALLALGIIGLAWRTKASAGSPRPQMD